MEADDVLLQKIHEEYSAFLEQRGIEYSNGNSGFHVYVPLKNINKSFTQICGLFSGELLVADYCGNCYTGIRKAQQVAKAIRKECPGYRIEPEWYNASFEIAIYHRIPYTTAEDLHEHVLGVAQVVDIGVRIGRELLGKAFER